MAEPTLRVGEHGEPCPHDRPVGYGPAKCVKPRGHGTHWNGAGDVWTTDTAAWDRLTAERDDYAARLKATDGMYREAMRVVDAARALVGAVVSPVTSSAVRALVDAVDVYDRLTGAAVRAEPCPECGPGYRLGDEGCRHG